MCSSARNEVRSSVTGRGSGGRTPSGDDVEDLQLDDLVVAEAGHHLPPADPLPLDDEDDLAAAALGDRRQDRVDVLGEASEETLVRAAQAIDAEVLTLYLRDRVYVMLDPKDEEWHRPDEVQHRVTLTRPFYMGAAEVTQGQWLRCTGANPSGLLAGQESALTALDETFRETPRSEERSIKVSWSWLATLALQRE